MNLVLAVHHFPPRYAGGAERQARQMAVSLQARGHAVRVICVDDVERGPASGVAWTDELLDEGVAVRRLSFDRRAIPDPARWEYDNPWIESHVRAFLRERPTDVLHLISGYLLSGSVLSAAAAAGVPTVVSPMDFWFFCPRITMLRSNGRISTFPVEAATCAQCLGEERRRFRWLGRAAPGPMRTFWRRQSGAIGRVQARQAFLRKALRHASAVVCNSQFLQSAFQGWGVDARRLRLVRQGCDFAPAAPASANGKDGHLRLGYVGQVAPHKGVHVLVEAVRRLPSIHIQAEVYGDLTRFPSYVRDLQRRIGSDTRVSLAGARAPEQMAQVLSGLDALVVPSLWYENSPNVILEAFARRIPVLASDLGGMAELVQADVNGLLFEPGNPDQLAGHLQRLLDEPGLLEKLRKGIGPVKSVAEEIDELEAIYAAVQKGRL